MRPVSFLNALIILLAVAISGFVLLVSWPQQHETDVNEKNWKEAPVDTMKLLSEMKITEKHVNKRLLTERENIPGLEDQPDTLDLCWMAAACDCPD